MRVDDESDADLWAEILEADRIALGKRFRFITRAKAPGEMIRRSLLIVAERGAALRFLSVAQHPELARSVLPELLRLASTTHSDTVLVRYVIASLKNEPWFSAELKRLAEPILANGGEEEYRRIAELYGETSPELLAMHLDACRFSSDPDIREIADDFADD